MDYEPNARTGVALKKGAASRYCATRRNGRPKKTGKAREAGKVLRIVADNLATGKTKATRECLESAPGRFVPHFIPTHSS